MALYIQFGSHCEPWDYVLDCLHKSISKQSKLFGSPKRHYDEAEDAKRR